MGEGSGNGHRWATVSKWIRRGFKGKGMKGVCEKRRERWEKVEEKK